MIGKREKEKMHKVKILNVKSRGKSTERWNGKTIEDVNDMHAGINDEDNRNKCDNEANKVHRKRRNGRHQQ